MENKNNGCSEATYRMIVKGRPIKIKFKETETVGLKERIRDILTESYEERCLEKLKNFSK